MIEAACSDVCKDWAVKGALQSERASRIIRDPHICRVSLFIGNGKTCPFYNNVSSIRICCSTGVHLGADSYCRRS